MMNYIFLNIKISQMNALTFKKITPFLILASVAIAAIFVPSFPVLTMEEITILPTLPG